MPDLTDEQEIFAATETTEDNQAAAAPVEAPAAQPEPEPAAPAAGEVQPQSEEHPGAPAGFVPYGALKEERESRKAIQARLEHQEALINRLLQGQPQQPKQPPQEPAVKPELWDDPDAYVDHRLDPVRAEVLETREFYSRRLAEQTHGADKVQEAYAALDQAIVKGELDGNAVKAQLLKSMDPYGDIVQWHGKYRVISEVGSDPKAYEERLRAKILEELQAQAPAGQQPAGAPAAQTPTAPALPSLNRSYGNAGNVQGAISEEDIFNAAPAFGKRKA